MRTLETGCGASTVVFAAQGAEHTVVSPTRDEHDRVREYLSQVGIDDSKLTSQVGFSDEVLPRLCNQPDTLKEWETWYREHRDELETLPDDELFRARSNRQYDYVFVDGAHSYPYPAVDWHYAMKALKIGGRLLLDDIPIPAVTGVYRYMMSDPSWKLMGIYDDRAAAFELRSEPAAEDWTLQPYNRRLDYGFQPLPRRTYSVVATQVSELRRQLGDRMPGARKQWQRWRDS